MVDHRELVPYTHLAPYFDRRRANLSHPGPDLGSHMHSGIDAGILHHLHQLGFVFI